MALHRYVLVDPVTDQTLGTIPLEGVTYRRRVMGGGDLTGRFVISDNRLGELARVLTQRPLAVYVYRGASIWWAGITWTAIPSQPRRGESPGCDIQAAVFDQYPEHRRVLTEFVVDPPINRAAAVAALWDHMQAASSNASIGVDTSSPGTVAGDPWAGTIHPSSAALYSEALLELTTADPGVEWTIDVWADETGARHRRLRVAAELGDPDVVHLVATPSTVQGWGDQSDQTRRPTHAMARGVDAAKNVGGDVIPITSPVQVDDVAVAGGVLRSDAVIDTDDDDEARLPRKARRLLKSRTVPPPSVTVHLPESSSWSPGRLGEKGRVILPGALWDQGRLDTRARIIGVQVQPAERGRAEEVTFEFQTEG